MTKISIIVAVAQNNAIGKNNALLWHIPEDLKNFKKITMDHPLIMGRNTYLSLPVRPLPKRINIVITDKPEEKFEGCITVHSLNEALSECQDAREVFIIGGGMVYSQAINFADKLYITKVHQSYDADTFFPDIDGSNWQLISSEVHKQETPEPLTYSFLTYERK